jgi:hypothetical protein
MASSKALSTGVALVALATLGSGAGAQTQTEKPGAVRAPIDKPVATMPMPVTRVPAGVYTFTLNSFRITDTRSLHNDTDYVSISVAVNGHPAIKSPVKYVGNVNNGTHHVNLTIPDVKVEPNNTVAFVYSIVNSGYKANTLEQELQKLVNFGAEKGAGAGAAALCGAATGDPTVAKTCQSGGEKGGVWAIGKLDTIIFADCDGTVAGWTHGFTAAALAKGTANGAAITGTDDNKGTDSPHGCGANSRYYVSWTITGKPLPPERAGAAAGAVATEPARR